VVFVLVLFFSITFFATFSAASFVVKPSLPGSAGIEVDV
jgi:hypothetical protein